MDSIEVKTTDKGLETAQRIIDGANAVNELNQLIVAFHHAKLGKYINTDGIAERFGAIPKLEYSYLLQLVNGMANKIDELEAKCAKLEA